MANVCGVDKLLRVVVGVVVLALTFVGPFTDVLFPWGLLAVVPLATGLIGWCPAYSLLHIRTCR